MGTLSYQFQHLKKGKKQNKPKQKTKKTKKKRKKEKKQDFSQGRNTFNIVRDFLIEMSQISVWKAQSHPELKKERIGIKSLNFSDLLAHNVHVLH